MKARILGIGAAAALALGASVLVAPAAWGAATVSTTIAVTSMPLAGVEASVVHAPLSVSTPDPFAWPTRPGTDLLDVPPQWAPLLILLLVGGFVGFIAMSVLRFVILTHRRNARSRLHTDSATVAPRALSGQ